jgi:DNA-binding SARP family transcriptional activator
MQITQACRFEALSLICVIPRPGVDRKENQKREGRCSASERQPPTHALATAADATKHEGAQYVECRTAWSLPRCECRQEDLVGARTGWPGPSELPVHVSGAAASAGTPGWPELDAERARRALNSAIWRLRKLLATEPESGRGENLQTIGSDMVLEPAPWLDIDAIALQEAAALVLKQPAAAQDTAILNRIATVLHRSEGPFLDGDDSEWILEERERLHSLFLRAATVVACRLGMAGFYDDAIGLARRGLRFDPFREELVRDYLILLALDERRCEAIRYYDRWSKTLKAELDVTPLPATRLVMQEIRAIKDPECLRMLRARLAGMEGGTGDWSRLIITPASPPSLNGQGAADLNFCTRIRT